MRMRSEEIEMDGEKITEVLQSIRSNRNLMQVFCDWIAIMAINITNSVDIYRRKTWMQRENKYQMLISRYGHEAQRKFVTAMIYLKDELTDTVCDVLGKIYCSIGANDTNLKQFFTPDHIGNLLAGLGIDYRIEDDKPINLVEPCCGSGSIAIRVLKTIKEQGLDYRHRVFVMAQDIDINCVYMAYVQLSLLGVKAIISHGDFFDEKPPQKEQIFYTPEYIAYAAGNAGLFKTDNQ